MTVKYVQKTKHLINEVVVKTDILFFENGRAFLRMEEPNTGIPITVMIFNTDGTFTKIEELPDTLGLQLDSMGTIREF